MRSFARVILVLAVALIVFSVPTVVDAGVEVECFPFICN